MKLLILLCIFGIGLTQATYGSDENRVNRGGNQAKLHAVYGSDENDLRKLKTAKDANFGSSSGDSSDVSLHAANKFNFAKYGSDSGDNSLDIEQAKVKVANTFAKADSDSSDSSGDDISDLSALEAAKKRFARKLGADSDESLKEEESFLKTANNVMFAKYGSDSSGSEDKLMASGKKKLMDYVKECLLETQTEPQTLMRKLKQGKLDSAVTNCFYKKVGIKNPEDYPEGRKLTDDYINNEMTKYGIEPRMVKECIVKNESLEGARKCVLKNYLRI